MSYTTEFFQLRRTMTLASATSILDILWETIQPETVLDIGCATGIWLAEAQKKGVRIVKGIDGPWVPLQELEINKSDFLEHDLSKMEMPDIDTYDVAFCIEVAEHLPMEIGDQLIDFLTSHADVILFSAAIPGQGGTGHLNEQPQSYWFNRFLRRGFQCFDIIRPRVWNSPEVNVVYKQNMFVYINTNAKSLYFSSLPKNRCIPQENNFELNRIHPELFEIRANRRKDSIWYKAKNAIKTRIKIT